MQIGSINFGFEIENKGDSPSLIHQVHENRIQLAEESPGRADGVGTFHHRQPIYVFTADCLPVFLFSDGPKDPILALHCGWRGALSEIVAKGIEWMNLPAAQIHAILGPSIGPCCMNVRYDFVDTFEKVGKNITPYLRQKDEGMTFDLPQFVIETQLHQLPLKQIHLDYQRCTFCSLPQLPSFRRNGNTQIRLKNWVCKS